MTPTDIEQHLIEMGLLTLEELQARQSPAAPAKRPPDVFRDPRDANGEIPW